MLDHYLEVLVRKPGALPGATALVQARAAGTFTAAHEAFWAAARKAHGDSGGTRALVEVLLLHRHHATPTSSPASPPRCAVGAVSPDVVAVETRKHHQHAATPLQPRRRPGRGEPDGRRRLAGPPARPSCPLDAAAAAVRRALRQPAHRNDDTHDQHHHDHDQHGPAQQRPAGSPASRPSTPRSTAPAGCCACPPCATATPRSPTPPPANSCPTGRSWPSCCSPNATTATSAAPPAASTKPASPAPKTLGRLRLHRQHGDQPGDDQHPRRLRLGQQGPVPVPDR